ncbi:SDR family NAD(P)-dependent oxidoreductase [Novosphingobium sp. PY1]|jgi:NAD(P)-dependent dehydrogenase (short-subunit alcohol dehydrogenase family)|uniref:Short-chain dehydrogenase n=1 Tax=Ochrobactrum sp. PW1 TaxID=1882222 RepID=A0A292GNS6_9HYPH|nr:SDR family oxidoreductase [Novosphingobium sp. PY1]BBA74558.1 short-chain dehydrogenase [Ochrobactrum sp. PW1]GFM29407.1 short-chain dehydrogenase [Novosphingobium sp. PY1]
MHYRGFPFLTARPDEDDLPVLQGKTAVVTGGGTDIGRAVSLLFAREGANVVIADLSGVAGEETVATIEAEDGRACFFPGDLADPQFHLGLAAFAKHRYGWLDIAVNNAFIHSPPVSLAHMSPKGWDELTATISGIFYAVRAQIPAMIEAGAGAIVNIAGIPSAGPSAGGAAGLGALYPSMQGLIGLTKVIAAEYARQGIRANVVIPGDADFGFAGDPDLHQKLSAHPVTDRSAYKTKVAQAVLFLASSRSSSINGLCMPLNDGTSTMEIMCGNVGGGDHKDPG